jgi:hypothetical protein
MFEQPNQSTGCAASLISANRNPDWAAIPVILLVFLRLFRWI